jgi:hypothetical protein
LKVSGNNPCGSEVVQQILNRSVERFKSYCDFKNPKLALGRKGKTVKKKKMEADPKKSKINCEKESMISLGRGSLKLHLRF